MPGHYPNFVIRIGDSVQELNILLKARRILKLRREKIPQALKFAAIFYISPVGMDCPRNRLTDASHVAVMMVEKPQLARPANIPILIFNYNICSRTHYLLLLYYQLLTLLHGCVTHFSLFPYA
jgi:hypothetical protein